MAKIAAESFLTKKIALNASLTKIAKEESLEPHQVEYVASQANHAVWERLYGGLNKKASYDFPVADPNVVISDLQIKPKAIIKEASLDYLAAPTGSTGFIEKHASINLDSIDKTAAQKRQLKKEMQARMEKMSSAKEELERKMYVITLKSGELETVFVKEARTMVMQAPFADRGEAMTKIAEFVRSASESDLDLAKGLMKKLSAVLAGQGLIKQADLKAPEEYISENMPAKIVNGRHALYITIKTLRDLRKEYDPLHRGHEIVDSSLPELKEKIREL
jgi:uncharacterized membrane protein